MSFLFAFLEILITKKEKNQKNMATFHNVLNFENGEKIEHCGISL